MGIPHYAYRLVYSLSSAVHKQTTTLAHPFNCKGSGGGGYDNTSTARNCGRKMQSYFACTNSISDMRGDQINPKACYIYIKPKGGKNNTARIYRYLQAT